MIFVVLAICVAIVLGGLLISEYYDHFVVGGVTLVAGTIGFIVSIITLIILAIGVSGLKVVDQKIAMYEEENARIETRITDIVEQYQKYETDVFDELNHESPMIMVSLYPELKSDALVQSQIEIHVANNENIKALKEEKLNGTVYRWWLYFGK